MMYQSSQMEDQAVLATAARMCAAARTAPKAKGIDNIMTLVLTGEEKETLAAKMDEIAVREFAGKPNGFGRDANNVRSAQAVVLIGVKRAYTGLTYCSFCGFSNCGECQKAGARCAYNFIDLGIALSSAVASAADDRVDTRIMYSIGKAAQEMGYAEGDVLWHGIPLIVSGKSIFFDR